MILLALIIGAIGTFVSFIYVKNIPLRSVLTAIFLVILVGTTWGAVQNDNQHFMMKPKTTTHSERIYATKSSNGLNMMVYQNLGTQKKHNVQTYKRTANQKNPSHTQVDSKTVNRVKFVDGDKATLTTTTKNWAYTKAGKIWFGTNDIKFGNDKSNFKLIKRTNTFYIPKNWIHLSANQAKQLGKQMKASQSSANAAKQQAMLKKQGQAFVQGKLKQALTKDPKLATDKAATQKLAKQFAAEFKQQVTNQKITEIKKMVSSMAE